EAHELVTAYILTGNAGQGDDSVTAAAASRFHSDYPQRSDVAGLSIVGKGHSIRCGSSRYLLWRRHDPGLANWADSGSPRSGAILVVNPHHFSPHHHGRRIFQARDRSRYTTKQKFVPKVFVVVMVW
ncbi:unnamed protein product, partial [Ectocarpus sp. 4 AP-2014]